MPSEIKEARMGSGLLYTHSLVLCSYLLPTCRRFEMDRDPSNARYCAECSKLHAAEEGDFWAESSMLGLKITYFALMDGKVYDITGKSLL